MMSADTRELIDDIKAYASDDPVCQSMVPFLEMFDAYFWVLLEHSGE